MEIVNADQLVKFDLTEAVIAKMSEEFFALKVESPDDLENYKKCDEARKLVKKHRTAVEARRKDLKEESLTIGRMIDGKAKELTAKLLPIEEYLDAQKKIVDDEIKRKEQEAIRIKQERLQSRQAQISAVKGFVSAPTLEAMTNDEFIFTLQSLTEAFNKEEARKKAEAEELEKLRAERLAVEEKLKQLAAENAKLEAAKLLAEQSTQKVTEAFQELSKSVEASAEKLSDFSSEIEKQAADVQDLFTVEAQISPALLEIEKDLAVKMTGKMITLDTEPIVVPAQTELEIIKIKFDTLEKCWYEIARLRGIEVL